MMSASPRLSIASRVLSSGIDLNTSRFTLDVLLRDDPRRARGRRRVERHEIRPRLLQAKAHVMGVHDVDGGHPCMEDRRAAALVALFTSLRSTKSYVSPSFDAVHDS